MINKKHEHLNIDAISKIIADIDNFALYHTQYECYDTKLYENLNNTYYICVVNVKNGKIVEKLNCVYDNNDLYGNVIMSKYEMLLMFETIFGKSVNYEINFKSDGSHSNDTVEYIGKIRKCD